MDYPSTGLLIAGRWRPGSGGDVRAVHNPATGEVIGNVALASATDLDEAVAAGVAGFDAWRQVSGFERAQVLRRAANLLRERVETMAPLITLEQGKPLAEARGEVMFAAEVTDWFADEARRTYGRLIPGRGPGVSAQAVMEPLGLIAGLTPWNYPVGQAVRKIAIALAAGCAIIVKVAEDTPAAAAEMVRAFTMPDCPRARCNWCSAIRPWCRNT